MHKGLRAFEKDFSRSDLRANMFKSKSETIILLKYRTKFIRIQRLVFAEEGHAPFCFAY